MYSNYEEDRGSTVTENNSSGIAPVTIKQNDESVTPPFVLVFASINPLSKKITHMDMCRYTEVEEPDNDVPTIIGGVVTASQLDTLMEMKPTEQDIKVISGDVIENIVFDQFSYSEASPFLRGLATPGEDIDETLFKFKLQVKQ